MKKNKVKLLIIYIMTAILIVVGFSINSTTILAVPSTKDVLQNAPAGMKVKNYMDKVDTYSGGGTNQAKITYAGDGNSYPSDTVRMLSAEASDSMQLGSIWGSVTGSGATLNGNYFDLYKPQKVSAWVYMGDAANPTIDGLAFVIQNDPNGYDAISRYNGVPKGGETLGVWGATATPEVLNSPISPEKNAIQNSVAIELDSTMNKDYNWENDNSFDSKNNGEEFKLNHIAWGYPGQSDTYKAYEKGFSLGILNFKKYYYEMNHNIFRNSNNMLMSGYDGVEATVGNAWRHLVITYTPIKNSDDTITSGTIDYLFNDQFPDGTKKKYTDWNSGSGTIDLSALNAKATSGKAMWGFTAATGSPDSATKDIEMVFENMPMVANVTSSMTMTDVSTDRVIEDYEKNKNKVKSTVYNGAKLNFNYQLHYDSGMADTGEITTSIGLPQNVDYKPDSGTKVGTITYTTKDGMQKTEELNFDQITEGSNLNGDKINVINLTLYTLSSANPDIEISIDGKAVTPDNSALTSTTVNGEHTSYRSDEYSDDVMTPMFLISNESLKITNSNDLNQTVLSNEKISLTGTVKYEKGSAFNGQELTAKAIIDGGKAIDTWTESTTDGASLASFNRSIDASSLELGDHTIEVQLSDSNNVVSNTLTYNVHIDDYKKLVLTPRSDTEFNIYNESVIYPEVSVAYDTGQFYDATVTMHWILDGVETTDKVTGDAKLVSSLIFNSMYRGSELDVGEHELIAYVSDDKRESNRITFKINVGERELIAKADPNVENITVTSDEQKPPFNLSGTYEFSDGSTENEKLTGTYTIKNEGYDAQDSVDFSTVADGKFNFTVKTVYQNGTTNSVPTIDKRMADPKSPGIREGRNEITVELHNTNYQSNTVKFVIDVPKLTPIISADDEYKVRSRNYIQVPINFEYSNNHDYVTKVSGLNDFYKSHDVDDAYFGHFRTPTSDQDYGGTPIEYTSFFPGTNTGITGDGRYTVDSVVYDIYGRKSNTESFVIDVKSKEMSLEVNNYGFQPLRYGEVTTMETGLLQRSDKWDITVNSYKTSWNLYAKQDDFFYKTNDDGSKSKMTAYIIYEENNYQTSLYQQNVLIASESDSGLVERTRDVTENWDEDDGIFLSVNDYGQAGTYMGTIDWTLTDVEL